MKHLLYTVLGFLSIVACNTKHDDPAQEDYQKLFPFKGIEKPKLNYEDLVHNPCDIDHYTYPEATITENVRTYTVTLTCQFQKGTDNTREPNYYVRYANAQKQLITLRTTAEVQTVSFAVTSGYPMYLGVYGIGERDSRVTARISAADSEGVVIIPDLQYTAAQNTDGSDAVQPFCEYIILP